MLKDTMENIAYYLELKSHESNNRTNRNSNQNVKSERSGVIRGDANSGSIQSVPNRFTVGTVSGEKEASDSE